MITPVTPLLFTLLSFFSQSSSTPPSTSDAWLWQREHTDVEAIAHFADFSSGQLHLLAVDDAFVQRDPRLPAALVASHTPTILTIRLTRLGDIAVVVDTVAWWRARGVDVRAVEIDHDCGVRALPGYATWLSTLKTTLSKQTTATPLWITALPAWWTQPTHAAVLAAVDDVTVQLHAIRAPALFDVDDALRFVRAHPALRVALPTYAVTLRNGPAIFAHAADVARVRAEARRVTWFRLPARADVTAWSWPTLRAVDAGPVVTTPLSTRLAPQPDGAVEIFVVNTGAVDVALTDIVVEGALVVDVIAGFALVDSVRIAPTQARFVAPGSSVVVGWARARAGETVRATVR